MEVTLIVTRGKVSRNQIVFHPPAVLGRSREADVTIAHPMISRQHSELYEVDGLLMIRDLGSLNGTVVADRRVVESALCPEDCFSVGPVTFQVRYRYDGNPEAVPPPKLGEPAESPRAAAPDDEPAPTGPPMFAEIASAEGGRRGKKEGPWENPMPAEEDEPWADAMPAEDEPEEESDSDVGGRAFGVDPRVPAESSPGAAAFEPTAREDGSWAGSADTVDEDDRAAGVDVPEMADEEPLADAPEPEKEKRGWKLWPFGSKAARLKARRSAPAVGGSNTEAPDVASAEGPPEWSGPGDMRADEAVADFLAAAPESEEPDLDDEKPPDEAGKPTDGDDAFRDFLNGLQ